MLYWITKRLYGIFEGEKEWISLEECVPGLFVGVCLPVNVFFGGGECRAVHFSFHYT